MVNISLVVWCVAWNLFLWQVQFLFCSHFLEGRFAAKKDDNEVEEEDKEENIQFQRLPMPATDIAT